MRALMARVKSGTWAVFHVIIPCNCRYTALPNKGGKKIGRSCREMGKTSLRRSCLTHIACDGRRPPRVTRFLTSAFCNLSPFPLSLFLSSRCARERVVKSRPSGPRLPRRSPDFWDTVENLCGSDIWIRLPLFRIHTLNSTCERASERTTGHVGISELMRRSLVESTVPTSRMNYECAK